MRKLLPCALVLAAMGFSIDSASADGACAGIPATVTMALPPTVTESLCDGLCGGLMSIGLGGPVASGAPVGSGHLKYVDQWHGQCKIQGGALNNKCQADTRCKPGWQKFADGGVWKCKQTGSLVVPNPDLLACVAKGDLASGKKHLTASERASAARAAFGKKYVESSGWSNEVRDNWVAWSASLPPSTSRRDLVLDAPSAIMEVLVVLFKQSVAENNEDKKYYLLKLAAYNALSEKLGKKLSKAEQKALEEAKAAADAARKKADESKARLEKLTKLKSDFETKANLSALIRNLIAAILESFKP